MNNRHRNNRQPQPAAPKPEPETRPVEMTPAPQGDIPAMSIPKAPISADMPFVMAHEIVSHTFRGNNNYFYFGRIDVDPFGSGQQSLKIVAQVAMPLDGFLNSFFLLEATVRKLRDEGIVTQAQISAGRARYMPQGDGGI